MIKIQIVPGPILQAHLCNHEQLNTASLIRTHIVINTLLFTTFFRFLSRSCLSDLSMHGKFDKLHYPMSWKEKTTA